MRFVGVKDPKYMADLEAVHAEAVAKIMALNVAYVQDGRAQRMLEFLQVEISPRLATCAGKAITNRLTGAAMVKMNYRLLRENGDELRDTYLHELAHILANFIYNDNCGHDWRWQLVARQLGAKPERCHKMDVSHLRPKRKPPVRIDFTCGCEGRVWKLTKARFDKYGAYKLKYGRTLYSCPYCKKVWPRWPARWPWSKRNERTDMTEKQLIEVVEYGTGNVVKTLDVTGKSEQYVEKVDNGLNRNLNHERFYTRIVGEGNKS